METFHRLQERGKTIVLITHDPGIAAEADRAVTIRDGRLHEGAYIPHIVHARSAANAAGATGFRSDIAALPTLQPREGATL